MTNFYTFIIPCISLFDKHKIIRGDCMEFLPQGFVTVYRIRLIIAWILIFAVYIILKLRFTLVFIFVSGIFLLVGLGYLPLYRRSFRFILINNNLEVRSGVFYYKIRKIPLSALYGISRSQTPAERLFKLSTVRVHASGILIKIPCLTNEQASGFSTRTEGSC